MRRALLLTALAMVAGLGACGPDKEAELNALLDNQSQEEPPPPPNSVQAIANSVATTAKFEIALSQVADINSSASPATKAFARAMIAEHKAAMDRLRVALAKLDPPPMADAEVGIDQQAALDNLRPKRGAVFDATFRTIQIQTLRESLRTLEDYAAKGEDPALLAFVRAQIPEVRSQLRRAEALPAG